MKNVLIWFWLMGKRTVKKPAFLLFVLIMPLMSFMIDRLGQGESAGVEIGILPECQEQDFPALLREQEGILQFRLYEDEREMCLDVESGELDCGVLLHEDLWGGLAGGEWREKITIYVTSSSSMTEIVKEKIASIVFTIYSENHYLGYIERSEAFARAEETVSRAEIVSFAEEAYERHLLDGSTFDFQYHQDTAEGGTGNRENAGEPKKADNGADWDISLNNPFRLRGVLAVCIFLSGLCGLLTDWKDREEKRFLRLVPPVVTTMVNIWVPTILTSAAALISLWLTGNASGFAKETTALIFYQFLIVLYCSIIRMILRKQEAIAAAIPLLTLFGIVCCPVWIRLALYVPLFRVLEKLFPITYYLLL